MATRIQKDTAKRMIGRLNKELDVLFQKQEMGKGGRVAQKCCRGGRLRKQKAQGGLQLGNAIQDIFGGIGIGGGTGLNTSNFPFFGSTPQSGLQSYGGAGAGFLGGLGSNQFSTPQTGNTQGLLGKIGQFFQNPLVGKIGRGLGNLAYTGASFAPALYNIGQGLQPAEQIRYADYRNPEYNKAVGLMAGRRWDPSQQLEAAEEADAVYRQQIRGLPTSLGALQNRLAGAATRRFKGRSGAFREAQLRNLGYEGEEAQFRAGLGAQDVGTRFNVEDINARNRAARRGFLGSAVTNMQQIAMQNRLMSNLRQMDERLFNLAQSMVPNYQFDEDYRLGFRS